MLPSQHKPKLFCDENIPKKLVELLIKSGFDVKTPELRSKDSEIIEKALSENRVLLTFDRHFGNVLLFPPEKYAGVIFIRINPPLIKPVFSSLGRLFNSVKPSEFKGKLFTLTLSGFREYPRYSE